MRKSLCEREKEIWSEREREREKERGDREREETERGEIS